MTPKDIKYLMGLCDREIGYCGLDQEPGRFALRMREKLKAELMLLKGTKAQPKNGYPANWKSIASAVKERHGWKCERCGHDHEVDTGYVLTVHHLDGDKSNCSDWNLAALCQRCHLKIQARVKMGQLFFEGVMPVSDWFKPHLEGYLSSVKTGR